MMPNLDTTGHWWVSTLALFWFKLEYQKGADNGTVDVLSQVPINHSQETVQSLLEGVSVGVANLGEVRVSKELLEQHEHLNWEVRVQAAKLAPMHIIDWEEAQEADAALATCHKWLHLNSLVLNKGIMYMSTTQKSKTEGFLTFVVPVGQHCMAINGVHHDASHQGQQRTLALAQERFWWPMMAEDCRVIVRGCPHC